MKEQTSTAVVPSTEDKRVESLMAWPASRGHANGGALLVELHKKDIGVSRTNFLHPHGRNCAHRLHRISSVPS